MNLDELTDIFNNLSATSIGYNRGMPWEYETILDGINNNAFKYTALSLIIPAQDEAEIIKSKMVNDRGDSIAHFQLKLVAGWYIKKTYDKNVYYEKHYRGSRVDAASEDSSIIIECGNTNPSSFISCFEPQSKCRLFSILAYTEVPILGPSDLDFNLKLLTLHQFIRSKNYAWYENVLKQNALAFKKKLNSIPVPGFEKKRL